MDRIIIKIGDRGFGIGKDKHPELFKWAIENKEELTDWVKTII